MSVWEENLNNSFLTTRKCFLIKFNLVRATGKAVTVNNSYLLEINKQTAFMLDQFKSVHMKAMKKTYIYCF